MFVPHLYLEQPRKHGTPKKKLRTLEMTDRARQSLGGGVWIGGGGRPPTSMTEGGGLRLRAKPFSTWMDGFGEGAQLAKWGGGRPRDAPHTASRRVRSSPPGPDTHPRPYQRLPQSTGIPVLRIPRPSPQPPPQSFHRHIRPLPPPGPRRPRGRRTRSWRRPFRSSASPPPPPPLPSLASLVHVPNLPPR